MTSLLFWDAFVVLYVSWKFKRLFTHCPLLPLVKIAFFKVHSKLLQYQKQQIVYPSFQLYFSLVNGSWGLNSDISSKQVPDRLRSSWILPVILGHGGNGNCNGGHSDGRDEATQHYVDQDLESANVILWHHSSWSCSQSFLQRHGQLYFL